MRAVDSPGGKAGSSMAGVFLCWLTPETTLEGT
jgi:hypothetical protein